MEFKGTKGIFKDGNKGWKYSECTTNGVKGYEIHWSDDGECVTDHVYQLEDAKLIASAPELLEALQEFKQLIDDEAITMYDNLDHDGFSSTPNRIYTKIEQAINKALK